mgnify:CR=1 FL=1
MCAKAIINGGISEVYYSSKYEKSGNGDLVGRMYLEVNTGTVNIANYGHALVDNVEVQVGGQMIDKHYGHWMEAFLELTEPNETGNVYRVRRNVVC